MDPLIFLSDPDPRSHNPDLRIWSLGANLLRIRLDPGPIPWKFVCPMKNICCQIGTGSGKI